MNMVVETAVVWPDGLGASTPPSMVTIERPEPVSARNTLIRFCVSIP